MRPRNTFVPLACGSRSCATTSTPTSCPRWPAKEGVIRGPAARGRAAAVAQDDIADAAVTVLRDPEQHTGITYSLTGPQALSLDDVAATLSAEWGRPVKIRTRDRRGGLRLPCSLRRSALAGQRMGLDLRRDRKRRVRGVTDDIPGSPVTRRPRSRSSCRPESSTTRSEHQRRSAAPGPAARPGWRPRAPWPVGRRRARRLRRS